MFKINLNGRISTLKLPKKQAMFPIYEAIVNSIHSIQSRTDNHKGKIKVILEREFDDLELKGVENNRTHSKVVNVIIEDDGIGFDCANYESFLTSDSRHKVKLGGKGIGRLLWLKAFDNVKVESTFSENDKIMNRFFKFNLKGDNIHDHSLEPSSCNISTRVSLIGFKDEYANSIPKKMETIAFRIIEHTISYFLLQDCPEIILVDGSEQLNLLEMYNEIMKSNLEEETFLVKREKFHMYHVKLYTSEDVNNRLHYCANRRQVSDINLSSRISDLSGRVIDETGEAFTYAAFITGNFLDKNVDAERTGFNILNNVDKGSLYDRANEISLKDIEDEAVKYVESHLKCYLEPIRIEKRNRIDEYIHTEVPQYRHLTKYDQDLYNDIQPGLSKDKLEYELFKRSQLLNCKFKEEGAAIMKKPNEKIEDFEEYRRTRFKYLEMANDIGKSNLAQYIMHRKIIIEFFENGLAINEDYKYSKEEYIHNIIFPLRSTSDDLSFEEHNLWLIDEKLAYHHYLASDIPFSKMDLVDSDSKDRPDIMMINNPISVVNDDMPHSSIVIFELKRPERDDYQDKDNPIVQLRRYVQRILQGNVKNKNGRTIRINKTTPFYLYILCDITDKIDEFAGLSNLIKTPDGLGYFGHNKICDSMAYIEIISFDKLLNDAKKRNQVLFDKLFNQGVERLNYNRQIG